MCRGEFSPLNVAGESTRSPTTLTVVENAVVTQIFVRSKDWKQWTNTYVNRAQSESGSSQLDKIETEKHFRWDKTTIFAESFTGSSVTVEIGPLAGLNETSPKERMLMVFAL